MSPAFDSLIKRLWAVGTNILSTCCTNQRFLHSNGFVQWRALLGRRLRRVALSAHRSRFLPEVQKKNFSYGILQASIGHTTILQQNPISRWLRQPVLAAAAKDKIKKNKKNEDRSHWRPWPLEEEGGDSEEEERTWKKKKQKIRHGINGQTPGDQWRWHLKCGVGIIRQGPINPCSSQQDALTFPENKTSICLIARMTRPGSTLCSRHDAHQGCINTYVTYVKMKKTPHIWCHRMSSDALRNKHL